MACISKLESAIAYDCETGATGLVSAFIINKADIASYNVGGDSNVSITIAPGAKAYKIDTVKRSLVVSSSLKVNDGAPNAYAHKVSGVITDTYAIRLRSILRALTNGQFVVCVKPVGDTDPRVYGMYYGLSATAIENSSHENGGWFSFTLETPGSVVGEDQLVLSIPAYNEMYAAAVG